MPVQPTAAHASLVLHGWTWLVGSREVTSVCQFEGAGPDRALLELLGKQLDRCSPANLTAPAAPSVCECAPALLHFLLGLGAGLLFALLAGGPAYIWRPRLDAPPQPAGQDDGHLEGSVAEQSLALRSVRSLPATPSSRAALSNGADA